MELFSINKFLYQLQVSFSYLLIIYHQLAGHMLRNRLQWRKYLLVLLTRAWREAGIESKS